MNGMRTTRQKIPKGLEEALGGQRGLANREIVGAEEGLVVVGGKVEGDLDEDHLVSPLTCTIFVTVCDMLLCVGDDGEEGRRGFGRGGGGRGRGGRGGFGRRNGMKVLLT